MGGSGELYLTGNGTTFVSRGAVYERLDGGGQPVTFDVGLYDAAAADAALADLDLHGYNTVRVFVGGASLADVSAPDDLSGAYVGNVVDFLGKARARGIQVILVAEGVPPGTSYAAQVAGGATAELAGENAQYLTSAGVSANAAFWAALAGRLTAQPVLRETILSYELRREAYFRSDQAPLTLASGTVTPANGQSYDLAVPAERQALMDDGLVHWADSVRAAIRAVDPTALVSLGFLWPQGPNPARIGDPRVSRMRAVLDDSQVDFVSPRVVPGLELTLPQYVENYELPATTAKPVLMAELGAPTASSPTAAVAAETLQSWQADSCAAGFDGWLLWTWDTDGERAGEPPMWDGQDAGGLLERALAPTIRTDPCAPTNVALGKPVTASSVAPGRAGRARCRRARRNALELHGAARRMDRDRPRSPVRHLAASARRRPDPAGPRGAQGLRACDRRRGAGHGALRAGRVDGGRPERRDRAGEPVVGRALPPDPHRLGPFMARLARDPGLQGALGTLGFGAYTASGSALFANRRFFVRTGLVTTLVALAVAGVLAAPAAAATPTERKLASQIKVMQRQVKVLQGQVKKLRADMREVQGISASALVFSACSTAATADAFQGTWETIDGLQCPYGQAGPVPGADSRGRPAELVPAARGPASARRRPTDHERLRGAAEHLPLIRSTRCAGGARRRAPRPS